MLIALLVGFQSYLNMPRAYDPGFIIRAAQVVTYFPGASPERVEQLVSDKIEKAVQEIPEPSSLVLTLLALLSLSGYGRRRKE